jgi:C-terminal processing protease CtpA/Prc
MYKDDAINSDFAYDYFLAYGSCDSFLLKFRNAGTNEVEYMTVQPQTMSTISGDIDNDTYYSFPGDFYYDFIIEDDQKAAVLTIRTFNQESYSQSTAYSNFLKNSFSLLQLKGIKNLIIDYRNNKGGYFRSSYELLSYFIAQPLMQFDSVIKRFNRLPYKDYVAVPDSSLKEQIDTSYDDYRPIADRRYRLKPDQIDTCFPGRPLFKGKLFIITNGNVISAAASSVALLKERVGAVIVGEETGGGYMAFNSKILTYILPNTGIKVDIPTLRYYPPVKKKENTNGVRPDYYRPVTRTDFKDFNDGPLQFILDTLIH